MDLKKHGSQGNEDHAEEDGSKNAPKENLMLVFGGDSKKPEDHDKNEEIIDSQGLFDDEARKKLQCGVTGLLVGIKSRDRCQLRITGEFMFAVKIERKVKKQGQRDPEDTPPGGFLHPDGVGFTVKNPQIQGQDSQNENQKSRVKPEILAERKKDDVDDRHVGTLAVRT